MARSTDDALPQSTARCAESMLRHGDVAEPLADLRADALDRFGREAQHEGRRAALPAVRGGHQAAALGHQGEGVLTRQGACHDGRRVRSAAVARDISRAQADRVSRVGHRQREGQHDRLGDLGTGQRRGRPAE